MEVSSSAVTGSIKLALEVVTNQKRPVLEIYWEMRNQFGPPQDIATTNIAGDIIDKTTMRFQDIHLNFFLINIGGVRAENIDFELKGDFSYMMDNKELSDIRLFRDERLPQFPPAQKLYLFRFDISDLQTYNSDGKSSGLKQEAFTIRIRYNGPDNFINKLGLWWARIHHKHQYESTFTFSPRHLEGIDLPPVEYL